MILKLHPPETDPLLPAAEQDKPFLINPYFKENPKAFFVQALLGGFASFCILFYLSNTVSMVIAASYGACCFTIFSAPSGKTASYRSNLLGCTAGCAIGWMVHNYSNVLGLLDGSPRQIYVVGTIALLLSILFLNIFSIGNPSGAALAFGIAINGSTMTEIITVLAAVLGLVIFQAFFCKWIQDIL